MQVATMEPKLNGIDSDRLEELLEDELIKR
jgi:hypothetical protein